MVGRGMKTALLLALFALLLHAAFSIEPMHMLAPVETYANAGSEIDVGTIGPGQSFEVKLDPIVRVGGINGIGGRWDQAFASSLPDGWSSKPSKLYDNPLQVVITAAPDAPDGDYQAVVKMVDEGNSEQLGGELPATIIVHVRKDVMSMRADPQAIETSAGQPARYYVTISNLGTASDRFVVSSSGVSSWEFSRTVYLAPNSSKTIAYEVVGEEETLYNVKITARSLSSPLISQSQPVSLMVRSNLISDYKATSNGVLLFPFLMAPMYSLAGLIALILG